VILGRRGRETKVKREKEQKVEKMRRAIWERFRGHPEGR